MDSCKFETLKIHSAGDKFAPVENGSGLFHLQNGSGQRLIGNAGKVYEFISLETAQTWLASNLARVKNAKERVSIIYIEKLGEMYLDTGAYFLVNEINAINELNDGEWVPVLDDAGGGEGEADQILDGGNAYTNFNDDVNGGGA